ncbi:MAG: S-methyl-5-thioribose-1-phosphate isomerase [Bacteroidales bacterium]
MYVDGKSQTSIWYDPERPYSFSIIDQRKLPFLFETIEVSSSADTFWAIKEMCVRGAPLIGVTAAFGMYLAVTENPASISYIKDRAEYLRKARPTAVNLEYGINHILNVIHPENSNSRNIKQALSAALKLREEEIFRSEKIGWHGLEILRNLYQNKSTDRLNILTHCNAGWLACVDYGTALAPVYKAYESGIPVHVYVDETRPRNQGARLTAWELEKQGISHSVIPDNTGGLLMQKGMVDAVIVGSDRTSIRGDVINKIGTYLKALAAKDNHVPFYVALPRSTIDINMKDAASEAKIEQRHDDEVRMVEGWNGTHTEKVQIIATESPVLNYGFDITPSALVTGLITEMGLCEANEVSIKECMNLP